MTRSIAPNSPSNPRAVSQRNGSHHLPGIERPARTFEDAAQEGRRKPAGAHGGRLEEFQGRTDLAGDLGRTPEALLLLRVHDRHHVAGRRVVAVDGVLGEHGLRVAHAVVREADDRRRPLLAVHQQQRRQVLAYRRRQVAGVAAARAEPAELALEHDDVDARAPERERGGKPGEAAADDRDVGARLTGERRLPRACRFEIPADREKRRREIRRRRQVPSQRKRPILAPPFPGGCFTVAL